MDELSTFRDQFIWINQGQARKVCELHTSHIFNILKMLFNHVAVIHEWGNPVDMKRVVLLPQWFYDEPRHVGNVISMLAVEVDLRGDLEDQHLEAYARIMNQLKDAGHPVFYNA